MSNLAPEIVQFGAHETQDGWLFQGYVLDESPAGLVVTFGGLLAGNSTTVPDASGFFEFTAALGDTGTVSAQTTDAENVNSNVATCDVT